VFFTHSLLFRVLNFFTDIEKEDLKKAQKIGNIDDDDGQSYNSHQLAKHDQLGDINQV
tara:strand:- start:1309 stop:1482 length:174 start_codon:yes stop_codon:yes gene_type:complete